MNDADLTPAEMAEWERRTTCGEDVGLDDPVWRLANLYMCLDEGQAVHFVPTPEQRAVIVAIHMRGWLRLIIPKARQLGMSLLLNLISLDFQVFTEGFSGAWIDKTQSDAEKKKREKLRFAWERLPPELLDAFVAHKDTNEVFTIREKLRPAAPESTMTYGINYRGGTVDMLVISEWGTVQNDDRQRSMEIKAGAIPAVERAEKGLCVIETTWKGGLDGEIGPYVTEALETPEDQRGPKSWRIMFFGWQLCPLYRQSHGYIDAISAEYFRECEKKGVLLDHEQKLWYAEKRRTATSAKTIKEEYPTFVEECWENTPVGSIYGKWIEEARAGGRIINTLPPRDYPVHTFWDIGHPNNTVALLVQMTPTQIRIVDVLMETDATIEQRGEWMRQTGWDFGVHYFPWDADSDKDSIGTSPMTTFRRVFGPTCRVVPKCHSQWDGISAMRTNFNRCVFVCDNNAKIGDHSTPGARMKQFLEFLGRFRADRETSTGIAKDVPVHDRYSHCASAFAQLGLTILGGGIEHANSVGYRQPQARQPLKVIRASHGY